MATANKKSRASRELARPPAPVHDQAPMEFVVLEDNAGSYQWKILAGDGSTLGRSGDFDSYDGAEQAAQRIRDGAASARFWRHESAPALGLTGKKAP